MSDDRWRWNFDDEGRPTSRPPAENVPGGPPKMSRRRRRRLGPTIAAVAVLVVLLAVALHRTSGPSARTRAIDRGVGVLDRRPAESDAKAVASVLAYTPFVRTGAERGHDVALTFDDGPGPYTPQILDVLRRAHVHATFFEIGELMRYFGASTEREAREGDVIGDHTETHPFMAELSAREQYNELFEARARIEALGGGRPVLFRPPYGSYNHTTLKELRRLHMLMVLWTVDTNDYQLPGVRTIVSRVLAGAKPGAIILLHDGGGDRAETVAALPAIIRGLRKRGLHPVTIPRLLREDPPPHGEALPPNLSGD
ncbi:MAG TPA: polysaccharide deacetylase family protein [Solirubrobacteraceae bacterium]|nr:polysaccharide deacetylase family protein [Solirubrobacteraceae bacterium]